MTAQLTRWCQTKMSVRQCNQWISEKSHKSSMGGSFDEEVDWGKCNSKEFRSALIQITCETGATSFSCSPVYFAFPRWFFRSSNDLCIYKDPSIKCNESLVKHQELCQLTWILAQSWGRARKTGTTTFTFPPSLPADIELFPRPASSSISTWFLRNNTMTQSVTRWVGRM